MESQSWRIIDGTTNGTKTAVPAIITQSVSRSAPYVTTRRAAFPVYHPQHSAEPRIMASPRQSIPKDTCFELDNTTAATPATDKPTPPSTFGLNGTPFESTPAR